MTTISPERLGFFEITPQDFQHPADEAALDTLKKARGIDWITKKVMELGFERIVRMQLIADSLKVSSQQCPSLFNMFHECCSILDISAIPEFFIECNPYPNAYTTGFTNPVVVVSSGLLEIVDDDELRFIFGHELGHVKCGHVLYQSMAEYLRIILEQIGNVTLGIGRYIGKGLELSFLLWSRKAEFTADRSGLLTCQKDDVAVKGLMKIAAPIDKIWNEVSVESIMEQAETFEELSEDTLSKVYKFFFGIQRTHPWLVLRTKEVKEWAASDEYTHLLKSGVSLEELAQKQRIRFDTVFSTSAPSRPKFCTNCGQPLNKTIKFCGYCGVSVG